MSEKQYKLWKSLNEDGLYTKSYEDFRQQFSSPQKLYSLYTMMKSDGYYTKPIEDFQTQYWEEPTATQNKYKTTRDYRTTDKEGIEENIKLEKKFAEKYGDKSLWTRYAYLNADEHLRDIIASNENKVDPYLMAGVVSAEGLVDQLYKTREEDPNVRNVSDVFNDNSFPISGIETLGIDNFPVRHQEFLDKKLTSLEQIGVNWDEGNIGKYFRLGPTMENEKGEEIRDTEFYSLQGGINAMSAYLKNIQGMVDDSGVVGTPEEKEFLIHVGYNYGEGGLKNYLRQSRRAKDVIEKIKSEKPAVYKNAMKRIIISKELRDSGSFEQAKNILFKK